MLKDSLAPSENHEIDCSRSIVIDCRCGEKLILLGHRSDWHGQGRTTSSVADAEPSSL